MLHRGLAAEIRLLADFARAHPACNDAAGIWVAIGYKEFLPFVVANDVPSAAAVAAVQARTRQYAKRQTRWLRIKLLNALRDVVDAHLFVLDAMDFAQFQERVLGVAEELVQKWLAGSAMPDPEVVCEGAAHLLRPSRPDLSDGVGKWERRSCAVCDVVAVTPSDWELHVKSRRHRLKSAKAEGTRRVATEEEEEQQQKING